MVEEVKSLTPAVYAKGLIKNNKTKEISVNLVHSMQRLHFGLKIWNIVSK